MYIQIKDEEVIVKAPIRLEEEYIKEFVNKKSKWIYEGLKKNKVKSKRAEKIEQKDIERLTKIVEKTINKYSKMLNVKPNKVRIKNIKYAWGSCSSQQNISISIQLAKKEEKVIEYVVLHEICHLIYMNHSKNFWKLVEEYMPEYQNYEYIKNVA